MLWNLQFSILMCFAPQRRALFRHLEFNKWSETVSFEYFWLANVLRATTACTFSTCEVQIGPETVSFEHFWLANVLRAITACNMFEQLNFQKCSGHGVILAFWLRNVLHATATYTFSTSQHPKVLWNRSVFNIFSTSPLQFAPQNGTGWLAHKVAILWQMANGYEKWGRTCHVVAVGS